MTHRRPTGSTINVQEPDYLSMTGPLLWCMMVHSVMVRFSFPISGPLSVASIYNYTVQTSISR